MLFTTFALAKKTGACSPSYTKMATALGGIPKYGKHSLIPLTKVIEVCGLQDALWALQCTTENSEKLARIFACDCVWRVLPIYESRYPGDMRVRNCIETARKFALGEATKEELDATRSAALSAANAADAADATWSAALSAANAADATDATWSATWSAVWDAALSAANAADATWSVAGSAARSAAWNAERKWQTAHFVELLEAPDTR